MNSIYDLFVFAGQSNMAGRGITSPRWPAGAPVLIPGAGLEYRAISDPEALHPLEEPFGVAENDPAGIFEPGKKTGSLVTAFVNAYYTATGVPVVGVSASKGGSGIAQWQGEEDFLSDALRRLARARQYLAEHEMGVRHCFLLWCQGETDGDHGTSAEEYKTRFRHMLEQFRAAGIRHCFLIAIGQYNGSRGFDYTAIHEAQRELARELPDVTLVSDDFWSMRDRGLMKDDFHYYQQAYNEVGTAAGLAAAAALPAIP